MYEFFFRHREFFAVLGSFILFRITMRTDSKEQDAFCQGAEIVSAHQPNYWTQFKGGEHVVELLDPVSASSYLHQTPVGGNPSESWLTSRLLFVIFYSPDSDFCIKSIPEFAAGAELVSKKVRSKSRDRKSSVGMVAFAAVNCKQNPRTCHNEKIDGYPTFLLYRDGVRVEEYSNLRIAPKFLEYIKVQLTKEGGGHSGWRSWVPFLSPSEPGPVCLGK